MNTINREDTENARRDLKKLTEFKLLIAGENNEYSVNFRALG